MFVITAYNNNKKRRKTFKAESDKKNLIMNAKKTQPKTVHNRALLNPR